MRPSRAAAALCALALVVTACGGDDADDAADRAQEALDDILEDAREAAEAGGSGGGDDGDGAGSDDDGAIGSGEVRPPEFTLTGPVEAPAGSVLDPASCVGPDESGPPFFDYFVPGDWIRRGAGASGSGGVTMGGDHRYELPDGTSVTIDIQTESYLGTEPLGGDGQPWESWDFDVVAFTDDGEETTRVTYDELEPVEIDGESFDLYALDQAQSEHVSLSEYKLRIVFAEVPTGGAAGQDRRPESAEVTIEWNAEQGDLSEAQVREVLTTFRLAECAQDGLVELYETLTGVDFPN